MNFKITTQEEKLRLDKYLTDKLPITRSQIQKLIKAGNILVNQENSSVHRFLKKGDVIKVRDKDVNTVILPTHPEPNDKIKFKIIYEDDDIIIIEKPAGLLVHPTDRLEKDTLVNGLLAYYPQIKNVGENNLRPGIVHRLDKDVSGLMLICKNQLAFEYYKKLFKTRKMKKIYTTLVHGKMEKTEDIIDMPIIRSKNTGRMAVRSQEQGGKQALTKYSVIKQYTHFALLEIQILTGRTHQIRAHLNALNHPVVGDKLYKQKKVKQHIETDLIFLHSTVLGFTDRHKKYQEFKSNLPPKLNKIIKKLK